jgi:hypothetical protein
MSNADNIAATIVPPYSPTGEAPAILEIARRHLEVATDQFYVALQRFQIWRVLAYDERVIARLGKGFATGGFLSVRSAIFEALLMTLTRMFDQGSRGKLPLSLKKICNDLCGLEVREFIAHQSSAEQRDFPARLALVEPLIDADRAIFEAQARIEAAQAKERINREFTALIRLKRAFNRPRIRDAMARLHQQRDTEIAHRDLEPVTMLPRPMYRDLDTLFGAATVLLRRMNRIGRNLDMNYGEFSYRAQLRALAFANGLRAETIEERRAISNEIKGNRTE